MDPQFEKLKEQVEADLGRPVDSEEEHQLKLLYWFGQGLVLSKQLESKSASGPEHIAAVAKRVMQDIKARVEQRRRSRVVSAVGDFLKSKKHPKGSQQVKESKAETDLWEQKDE